MQFSYWDTTAWLTAWSDACDLRKRLAAASPPTASMQRLLRGDLLTQPDPSSGAWTGLERNAYQWLKFKAWSRCEVCGKLYANTMRCVSIRHEGDQNVTGHCGCTDRDIVPRVADVPLCLQNLTTKMEQALRLIVIHQGSVQKHPNGHLRKTEMTKFSWAPASVKDRCKQLQPEEKRQCKNAWRWLMENNVGYRAWHESHVAHLETEEKHRLPPSTLLESYVETAIWPHLYSHHTWCESHLETSSGWSAPFEKGHKVSNYASMKAAFVQKLTCEIIDFGARYDLLQFQFDRFVFKDCLIKSSVSLQRGSQGHCFYDNRHWSPGHWQKHHRVLVDLVTQLGEPSLFVTISPYEWSFPFPTWLEQMFKSCGKGPTDCPGPETLSLVHGLQQVICGLMSGHHQRWRTHLFGNKTCQGESGVKAFFGRFEFQDKGQQQKYGKGRGTPHAHILFWFDNVEDIMLHREILATMPDDNELRHLAQRVLRGEGKSRAPAFEDESNVGKDATGRSVINIKHSGQWKDLNLRPALRTVLRILRCAQDVQWWHGRGALLRYVAGYASKYGEALVDDNFDVHKDAYHAALHMCRAWLPAAPEQVMALARESMSFTNAMRVTYRPLKFTDAEDLTLHLYRRRDKEQEALTLLQWLRCTVVTGSLDSGTFAAKPRRGQKLIAVGVLYFSEHGDDFYYQWLQMEIAHRSYSSLVHPRIWTVDKKHKFFCSALLLAPERWGNDAWVSAWLERQGHKSEFIATSVARLASRRWFVYEQLEGRIRRSFRLQPSSTLQPMIGEQERFFNMVMESVQDDCHQKRLHILSGGPGSGKSHIIAHLVEACALASIPVLIASPTGKLAVQSASNSAVVSTTVHRAFLKETTLAIEFLRPFQLWVISEVGMITKNQWDTISYCWRELGRSPVIVAEGDCQQLPPPVPEAALEDIRLSRNFPWFQRWTLTCQHRCQDAGLQEFQNKIRFHQPSTMEVKSFFQRLLLSTDLTRDSLLQAVARCPGAPVLVATRATQAQANSMILAVAPGSFELAIPTWIENSKVIETTSINVKLSCTLMITRNSEGDIVNGQLCSLLRVLPGLGLLVAIDGIEHVIHPRSQWLQRDDRNELIAAFDIELGYAMTVHKVQGATLHAGVIVFENFAPPGWGYTALTRFRCTANLIAIGDVTEKHFAPRSL